MLPLILTNMLLSYDSISLNFSKGNGENKKSFHHLLRKTENRMKKQSDAV
jgi:hypothetical protein